MKIISHYDKKTSKPINLGGKSRTKSEYKDEVNINTIMQKANQYGLPQQQEMLQYLDTSNLGDFEQNINKIKDAEYQFSTLPSNIRKHFDNTPSKLINFLNNPDNRQEAINLGILPKPLQTPQTPLTEPVNTPTEPETPPTPSE